MKAVKYIAVALLFVIAAFIAFSIWLASSKRNNEVKQLDAYVKYVKTLNTDAAINVSKVTVDSILNPLLKDSDSMEQLVWYSPSLMHTDKQVSCYITRNLKTKHLTLRFRLFYINNRALDIVGYKIQCDTVVYNYDGKPERKRVDDYGIEEISDVAVGPKELKLIKALVACNTAKIRFRGFERDVDAIIDESELEAIRDVYSRFRQSGGKVDISFSSFNYATAE